MVARKARAARSAAGRSKPKQQSAPEAAAPKPSEEHIVRFRTLDGLLLALRVFRPAIDPVHDPDRLPLLCLPGLSRNSRDFIALGRFFCDHATEPRTVVAVDYRGRGLSETDPNWRNYRPVVEAQDVLAAAMVLGIEHAIIVGTSRGGIIAMLLGALRPALLRGVVLNDIGPVIEGTGLARIKSYLSARRPAASLAEATAAVREATESQFPELGDDDWEAYTKAQFVDTGSGFAPQFDPKLVGTIGTIDLTEKIPHLWPQFMSLARIPVLVIRGAHSDLLTERTVAEMAERHPDLEQLTVPGHGHAPLLRDDPTLQRIAAFVARCAGE